jgi:hypothetical protein
MIHFMSICYPPAPCVAVIRVYDAAGNVTETPEDAGASYLSVSTAIEKRCYE